MASKYEDSNRDLILGILSVLFGGAVFIQSGDLPDAFYDPLGPAFMPRALAGAIMFCGLVIVMHGVRKRLAEAKSETRKADAEVSLFPRHPLLAFSAMCGMFLFILALDTGISGFRTLSILFVLALGGALLRVEKRGFPKSMIVILAGLALVLSFGLYYLFTQVFIVNLY